MISTLPLCREHPDFTKKTVVGASGSLGIYSRLQVYEVQPRNLELGLALGHSPYKNRFFVLHLPQKCCKSEPEAPTPQKMLFTQSGCSLCVLCAFVVHSYYKKTRSFHLVSSQKISKN